MGLTFLIVCLVLAAFVLIVAGLSKPKPSHTPEEKPDIYQDQAQPGQGAFRNVGTRFKARSDAKTQDVVNQATAIATEGIKLGSDALSAKLEKEVIPVRHEEQRAKEEAETETYLAVQEAVQSEVGLRKELATEASKVLLTVEDLSAVNKHRYLKDIDLNARQREIQQDLDAADRYELTQHELISKLTFQLQQLVKERRRIELEESDEYVRQRFLDRHDKNISVVEQLIDGRQTRLLLSENGQENRGDSPEDTDSRTDSQETLETDS